MAQKLARRAEDREVPGSMYHPTLTFQSCSRYQLNQLGSEAASESTFKKSNTCGVSNTRQSRLYFLYEQIVDVEIFAMPFRNYRLNHLKYSYYTKNRVT